MVPLRAYLNAKELTASTDLSIIAGYEVTTYRLSVVYLALSEVIDQLQEKTCGSNFQITHVAETFKSPGFEAF